MRCGARPGSMADCDISIDIVTSELLFFIFFLYDNLDFCEWEMSQS